MLAWSEVKKEFETDGSLRDIYVSEANEDIWDKLIHSLSTSEYRCELYHANKTIEFPIKFSELKRLQQHDSTILHVWIRGIIQLNCHFFTESEIEFDMSPYDVQSEEAYQSLCSFMFWLSRSLAKPVQLTHESSPEMAIIEVGSNGV